MFKYVNDKVKLKRSKFLKLHKIDGSENQRLFASVENKLLIASLAA